MVINRLYLSQIGLRGQSILIDTGVDVSGNSSDHGIIKSILLPPAFQLFAANGTTSRLTLVLVHNFTSATASLPVGQPPVFHCDVSMDQTAHFVKKYQTNFQHPHALSHSRVRVLFLEMVAERYVATVRQDVKFLARTCYSANVKGISTYRSEIGKFASLALVSSMYTDLVDPASTRRI
ncbi:hypothetical protein NPIL_358881 [Nephila pilipes]|uniref:Uncharacterized protein n=1 Tax=Nephila pilipes TaxID=299642 RepID=A0A8X6UBP9_NEPPI|nr:hypothetical protein NPIL_358881 [Nephila pilipes]